MHLLVSPKHCALGLLDGAAGTCFVGDLVHEFINTVTKMTLKNPPTFGTLMIQGGSHSADERLAQDSSNPRRSSRAVHTSQKIYVTVFSGTAGKDCPLGCGGLGK